MIDAFMGMSGSQKLVAGVTVAYIATALTHYNGGRKELALMFLGYSVANVGAFLLEGN
jgi:hypothetical protein